MIGRLFSYAGQTKTAAQWAATLGVSKQAISLRAQPDGSLRQAKRRPTHRGLTPSQIDTLRVLYIHLAKRGYPPTLHEIATARGIITKQAVRDTLIILSRKGYLEHDRVTARGIQVCPGVVPIFDAAGIVAFSPGGAS